MLTISVRPGRNPLPKSPLEIKGVEAVETMLVKEARERVGVANISELGTFSLEVVTKVTLAGDLVAANVPLPGNATCVFELKVGIEVSEVPATVGVSELSCPVEMVDREGVGKISGRPVTSCVEDRVSDTGLVEAGPSSTVVVASVFEVIIQEIGRAHV